MIRDQRIHVKRGHPPVCLRATNVHRTRPWVECTQYLYPNYRQMGELVWRHFFSQERMKASS
jgi:hypothetical protein